MNIYDMDRKKLLQEAVNVESESFDNIPKEDNIAMIKDWFGDTFEDGDYAKLKEDYINDFMSYREDSTEDELREYIISTYGQQETLAVITERGDLHIHKIKVYNAEFQEEEIEQYLYEIKDYDNSCNWSVVSNEASVFVGDSVSKLKLEFQIQ